MMASTRRPGETDREPIDDYHIDRGAGQTQRPATHHILALLNGLLLIVLAAVSLALFWVVATMLGVV